jgi:hypothetical protein
MHCDDKKRTQIFEDLIKICNVKTWVETGAWAGETTIYYSKFVEKSYTCESYKPRYLETVELCKPHPNIVVSNLPSPQFLQTVLVRPNVMWFLDAHWEDYWPLVDELKYISISYPKESIIIVDDTWVPNRPNFYGCDGGGGDEREAWGNRKTKDSTRLDINLILPNVPKNAQIIIPKYTGPYVGWTAVNMTGIEIKETEDYDIYRT